MDDVDRILALKTWAVVGLSPDPGRPSHGVARFLVRNGYRVLAVNPQCDDVLGLPTYPSLADVDEPVDVVDVFRRSALAGAHVDEAIAIGAKAVWLQLGVIDHDAAARAEAAGLLFTQDRCPAIELPRRRSA